MKPGMKMMVIDRMRQGDQTRNEYGGNQNRRMIGFDRDPQRERSNSQYNNMPHGAMPGHVRDFPPMSDNYEMNREWPMGRHPIPMSMGAYNGPDMTYGRHEEYPPHMGGYGRYDNGPEARRRRDRRGRYMMDGMDDDDEEDYSPRSMMRGYPRSETEYRPRMHHGGDYGDIYAKGMIYAPGAMNRPMGDMMGGDMSAPVDEHTARMWVQKMDGGEHFKPEQAEQYRGALCPECEKWEYYVAINAMYSDHCETAKKMGVDKPEYYAHVARDFLKDKDAGPHKLRKYMTIIPK